SFVIDGSRRLRAQLNGWREDFAVTEWERNADGGWDCARGPIVDVPEGLPSIYHAAMLGLRDYVDKNGFKGVVLGLSGGIDSAISAAIAVDALGADRVRCVMMPYTYTAESSLEDAEACAAALGVSYEVVPIFGPVEGF
ncbi:MAG: NAD+ synthase, partial [Alphaproteobacteria bacterium]